MTFIKNNENLNNLSNIKTYIDDIIMNNVVSNNNKIIIIFGKNNCNPCYTLEETINVFIEDGNELNYNIIKLSNFESYLNDYITSYPTTMIFENYKINDFMTDEQFFTSSDKKYIGEIYNFCNDYNLISF